MAELRWGDSDSSEDDTAPKVSEIMNRPEESLRAGGPGRAAKSTRGQKKNQKSGHGGNKSNWKEMAKSSAKFSTDKQENLDGSSWMAQRRAKQQQAKEEEAKEEERRLQEANEEKRARRKTQFEALKAYQAAAISTPSKSVESTSNAPKPQNPVVSSLNRALHKAREADTKTKTQTSKHVTSSDKKPETNNIPNTKPTTLEEPEPLGSKTAFSREKSPDPPGVKGEECKLPISMVAKAFESEQMSLKQILSEKQPDHPTSVTEAVQSTPISRETLPEPPMSSLQLAMAKYNKAANPSATPSSRATTQSSNVAADVNHEDGESAAKSLGSGKGKKGEKKGWSNQKQKTRGQQRSGDYTSIYQSNASGRDDMERSSGARKWKKNMSDQVGDQSYGKGSLQEHYEPNATEVDNSTTQPCDEPETKAEGGKELKHAHNEVTPTQNVESLEGRLANTPTKPFTSDGEKGPNTLLSKKEGNDIKEKATEESAPAASPMSSLQAALQKYKQTPSSSSRQSHKKKLFIHPEQINFHDGDDESLVSNHSRQTYNSHGSQTYNSHGGRNGGRGRGGRYSGRGGSHHDYSNTDYNGYHHHRTGKYVDQGNDLDSVMSGSMLSESGRNIYSGQTCNSQGKISYNGQGGRRNEGRDRGGRNSGRRGRGGSHYQHHDREAPYDYDDQEFDAHAESVANRSVYSAPATYHDKKRGNYKQHNQIRQKSGRGRGRNDRPNRVGLGEFLDANGGNDVWHDENAGGLEDFLDSNHEYYDGDHDPNEQFHFTYAGGQIDHRHQNKGGHRSGHPQKNRGKKQIHYNNSNDQGYDETGSVASGSVFSNGGQSYNSRRNNNRSKKGRGGRGGGRGRGEKTKK
eukprot:CAMPEP_0194236284 /NCGR_PEP_ID=MMETSP0158-20130606/3574_1 /TAXON_ID=33649 /ORGANISM="Thalassionema nitzschioides, Strain L26-B" /LENGTH=858 /DNA_ID=CAMNT_0038970003 /DNA_START=32 /DNA_END=2605 /DNA_ORIENTATION=-